MHLITGYAGYEHITSANDGALNSHVFGTDKYVFNSRSKFEANAISPNAITIGDGEGMINGRYFEIPKGATETATIENGTTSSVSRIDLIVARYELNDDTGIETVTLTVIKGEDASGEPVAPAYYDGSILDGNVFVDLPLYKVHINGINIGDIEAMFTASEDIPKKIDEINENLSDLNNRVGVIDDIAGFHNQINVSKVGAVKIADYPNGFTQSNSYVFSQQWQVGGVWDTQSTDTNIFTQLKSDGIYIYVGNLAYKNAEYKILLMRLNH